MLSAVEFINTEIISNEMQINRHAEIFMYEEKVNNLLLQHNVSV